MLIFERTSSKGVDERKSKRALCPAITNLPLVDAKGVKFVSAIEPEGLKRFRGWSLRECLHGLGIYCNRVLIRSYWGIV